MMAHHKEQRRNELLDGKTSWSTEDAGGDHDRFYAEFVAPLRQLKRDGYFRRSRRSFDGD